MANVRATGGGRKGNRHKSNKDSFLLRIITATSRAAGLSISKSISTSCVRTGMTDMWFMNVAYALKTPLRPISSR